MLPAPDRDDAFPSAGTPDGDPAPPPPAAPLGFSGVPAPPIATVAPAPAAPAPAEEPTAPPTATAPEVTAPTATAPEVTAPAEVAPPAAAPAPTEDWIPRTDDFLPAAPRPTTGLASLGVGAPKPGFLSRLRRRRDDGVAAAVPAPAEPAHDVTAPAPVVAPSTPDDREAYAFWSQDRAPRDFSDVMALPDLPLDGSPEH